jgi:hypothetical protein
MQPVVLPVLVPLQPTLPSKHTLETTPPSLDDSLVLLSAAEALH